MEHSAKLITAGYISDDKLQTRGTEEGVHSEKNANMGQIIPEKIAIYQTQNPTGGAINVNNKHL